MPQPLLPTESVRFRPTCPEEFPKPSGNNLDLEFSNNRADSQALAATTTARAFTLSTERVALSIYETPVALPSGPTMISRAMAPVINVSFPVFKAGGISTWLELKFDACTH